MELYMLSENKMTNKTENEIEFLRNLEERFAKAEPVKEVADRLTAAGFEPYLVGGCLRDLIMGRVPKDWDIATNARPEEIQRIFPDSVYENQFGTVAVKTESQDPTMQIVEVTTFRKEGKYSDKRHPDSIQFASTIEEDLSRRDFTINAMAFEVSSHKRRASGLVDPFGGRKDLAQKLIRAVGNPRERFAEDALRLIRAVRFASELDFTIEEETQRAIYEAAELLRFIAKERIRDELEKIIMSPNPAKGLEMLRELGLLKHILPELEEGWGVTQNKHHIYTVWEHSLKSLQYAADKNYSLEVRLAALLHDVAKPRTKRGEGPDATFYGHEVLGSRMAMQVLERLRFSRDIIEKIGLLIRAHMFNYDPEVVTDASVRRLIARVGPENIRELVQLREADRIGSGVAKAVPYKIRHFLYRVEKLLTDFPSLKNLKINGNDVMRILGIEPGPKVGMILNALFEEVLDDPQKNERAYLEKRIKELGSLSEKELRALAEKAKAKYEAVLEAEEEAIKRKYRVK
jgi:poly(A) polymerase/tRNA nucleotidyltransferase (CCA-adding enzyme)